MITLLGTGHVFRIEEQITFIIRNIWPDALLVELDPSRYSALKNPQPQGDVKMPWLYRRIANYQKRIAGEYGGTAGAEMMAAIDAAMSVGAVIQFIDNNASETVNKMWSSMPVREKGRLLLSFMKDNKATTADLESQLKVYSENEDFYLREMREKFPTLVEVLIDSRNQNMAERIRAADAQYKNIVVVIGDGHVDGIATLLSDLELRTIRLKVLMEEESMNALRQELSSRQKLPSDSPVGVEGDSG